MSRARRRGMSLVELIVAFSIMLILTTMAIPMTRYKVRLERERNLRHSLREMRAAISKYKDFCDQGFFGPPKPDTRCWPESLQILVEGMKTNTPDGKKMKFLRSIPQDPFTLNTDWGLRNDQDDTNSTTWGGDNVFDVYTKTTEKARDGSSYSDW
jgi:general secretion pathway protein G